MNATRLERLRGELDGLGAATVLVTAPANVRWLTGFESTNAALLVARAGEPLLLTDGRYLGAARGVPGVEVVQSSRDLLPFLGGRLASLAEPPVAFEAGHVSYAGWEALASAGVELVPAPAVVERLRAVKDEDEIESIRRSSALTNAVYERLASEGALAGRTEAEVAWRVAEALHEAGAEGPAFPTIVASGPNAALPHHHPGRRRIEPGETVIVDLGARLAGYASDCTRTFATGPLPPDLARAYEVCREAQAEALAAALPGASARAVDGIARARLEAEGYEVLHGLGHGLGVDVHELPRVSETSDATLAAGNVVTIEPGVYLPGLGGVRIEDLVVVRDGGPTVLTSFTKDLVTLG